MAGLVAGAELDSARTALANAIDLVEARLGELSNGQLELTPEQRTLLRAVRGR